MLLPVMVVLLAFAGVSAWSWRRAMACASTARRESRRAGAWSAATSLGTLLLAFASAPPGGVPVHAGSTWIWTQAALLVAALASILGGLSGKPRPSGQVALSCLGLGLGLLAYGLLAGTAR